MGGCAPVMGLKCNALETPFMLSKATLGTLYSSQTRLNLVPFPVDTFHTGGALLLSIRRRLVLIVHAVRAFGIRPSVENINAKNIDMEEHADERG